jgi:hypothetical protein
MGLRVKKQSPSRDRKSPKHALKHIKRPLSPTGRAAFLCEIDKTFKALCAKAGTGFTQKQRDHSRPESVFAFQIKGKTL